MNIETSELGGKSGKRILVIPHTPDASKWSFLGGEIWENPVRGDVIGWWESLCRVCAFVMEVMHVLGGGGVRVSSGGSCLFNAT